MQANREIALLKNLFNRTKAWGLYEGENPALGVKMLEDPKRRLRYLEYDEEVKLLEVSPHSLAGRHCNWNEYKPFTKACQDAGLAATGLSLHALRHIFASRLIMSGADLRTIQECGGWADLSLVQRYSHLSASHKTTAVERIAGEFYNAIHNRPASGEVVHLAERRVSV